MVKFDQFIQPNYAWDLPNLEFLSKFDAVILFEFILPTLV